MDKSLLEVAYKKAASHYDEVQLVVFRELSAAYPEVAFDDVHRAGIRAMELHLASLRFAERIWAASIAYEKAEESLISQFSEFPIDVCVQALNGAYVKAR